MYKIGVIGEEKKVMCFMAAGFCVYAANTPEEGAKMLKKAKSEYCAVIYITPELCPGMAEDIKKYADSTLPAIIPLPEKGGGYGITQLSGAVERAVGADIIFKEQ